jgi:hypothetical protein
MLPEILLDVTPVIACTGNCGSCRHLRRAATAAASRSTIVSDAPGMYDRFGRGCFTADLDDDSSTIISDGDHSLISGGYVTEENIRSIGGPGTRNLGQILAEYNPDSEVVFLMREEDNGFAYRLPLDGSTPGLHGVKVRPRAHAISALVQWGLKEGTDFRVVPRAFAPARFSTLFDEETSVRPVGEGVQPSPSLPLVMVTAKGVRLMGAPGTAAKMENGEEPSEMSYMLDSEEYQRGNVPYLAPFLQRHPVTGEPMGDR